MSSAALLPRLADLVLNRPLMIQPSKLALIASILDGRIGIDSTAIAGMAAAAPSPSTSRFVGRHEPSDPNDPRSPPKPYRTTMAGVAVIPVLGSLVNRASWLDAMSGLTSYERLTWLLGVAGSDPDVASIVLDIDSPGGEAIGAFEVAEAVRNAAKAKPVIAAVNGLAASAAYAIASASTKIVTTPSGVSGSIGVVMLHADHSKRLDKAGVAVTLIHAGARKVDGHPYGPLDDAAFANLQAEIDEFMDLFVDTVAKGRKGLSPADIREQEARTFIGAAAVKAGLADTVGTFESIVAELDRTSPIRDRLASRGRLSAARREEDRQRSLSAVRGEMRSARWKS